MFHLFILFMYLFTVTNHAVIAQCVHFNFIYFMLFIYLFINHICCDCTLGAFILFMYLLTYLSQIMLSSFLVHLVCVSNLLTCIYLGAFRFMVCVNLL